MDDKKKIILDYDNKQLKLDEEYLGNGKPKSLKEFTIPVDITILNTNHKHSKSIYSLTNECPFDIRIDESLLHLSRYSKSENFEERVSKESAICKNNLEEQYYKYFIDNKTK